MRSLVFTCSMLLGVACNGVLGIEEATLCEGSGCDAGAALEIGAETRPNRPTVSAAGLDAGSDAGSGPSRGGVTTDGVIQPGATPVDVSGSGSSGSGSSGAGSGSDDEGSSGSGSGGGESSDDGADDGNSDGSSDNGNEGNGNGQGNDGDGNGQGNNGNGNGNGGNTEPAPTPTPPPPPPPPPSPCAGRATGEAFCAGAVRTACGAGGAVTSALPCASEAHCLQGTGAACAVCLPGEASCEGATLLACNATRTGLDTVPCAGPTQCNAAAARCEAPACVPGQTRCDGASLQTCNATLTGFDPIADCGTPAACNAQTASCILCTPGAQRCIDAGTLAICDISGQFEIPSSCGVLEVCINGDCEGLDAVPVLPI